MSMKILIVSPFFPPQKTVAVVRIASLTRYLIKKKYDVTVMTNKFSSDDKLDSILKDVKIIDVDLDDVKKGFFSYKKIYEEKFIEIINKFNYDCVLITGGPFYTMGLSELSENNGIPCIIDFRDLWIFDVRSLSQYLRPVSLLKKLIFWPLEKKAIKHASHVVTVTDGWEGILKKVYFGYKKKISTIFNGYDGEYLKLQGSDKLNVSDIIENNRINIMSFGKLSYYSDHYAEIFLEAFNESSMKNNSLNLIQIGTEEEETLKLMKKINFDQDKYQNTGFCEYLDGMKILEEARAVVLIDIRKHAIGTKIYDYIYSNKPIIYVGKKHTYLAKLVASFDNGFTCHTKKDVSNALNLIIEKDLKVLNNKDIIFKFSREHQNHQYSTLIESVIGEKNNED